MQYLYLYLYCICTSRPGGALETVKDISKKLKAADAAQVAGRPTQLLLRGNASDINENMIDHMGEVIEID